MRLRGFCNEYCRGTLTLQKKLSYETDSSNCGIDWCGVRSKSIIRRSMNRTKISNCSKPRLRGYLHCDHMMQQYIYEWSVLIPASRPYLPPATKTSPPSITHNSRQSARQTTIRTHSRKRVVDIDFISPFLLTPPTKGRFDRGKGCTPLLEPSHLFGSLICLI
jgi:hypothetical protein